MSIRYSVRYVLQGRYQGLSLFDADFDLTWLTCLSSENGHLPGILRSPVQITRRTVLINRDVPQHVVQKILDHDSPAMTAHYARLSDKTVREHWERARKVNTEGQPVQIRADGPLGDAAWAKQHLSRATQALPNGYCQLPLVKTCPHANVLLTELRDVSAAQKVELPCRSVTTLTGMSRSAGRTGRDLDLGATESGHTALNGSPASSSLLLVSTSPIWP